MLRNQKGQGMVEYILIIALVVIAGIAVWGTFGDSILGKVDEATKELDKVKVAPKDPPP